MPMTIGVVAETNAGGRKHSENIWHELKEYILSLTFTCLLDTVPAFLPYPFEYMQTFPVLWEL